MNVTCMPLIALLVFAAAAPVGSADDEAAGAAEAEAPSGAARATGDDLARLVSLLGDPVWAERESAESRLKLTSASVLARLDPLLAAASDPEVLKRLQRVYRHHVPQRLYAGSSQREGFLGISMRPVPDAEEPMLGERQWGVSVASVIADTAAEKAGLQVGDLITAMDGEPFVGDVNNSHFSARITELGEGGTVTLTVVRGGERLKVEARLTRRPSEHGGSPTEPAVSERVVACRWRAYWKTCLARVRAEFAPAAQADPDDSGAPPEADRPAPAPRPEREEAR